MQPQFFMKTHFFICSPLRCVSVKHLSREDQVANTRGSGGRGRAGAHLPAYRERFSGQAYRDTVETKPQMVSAIRLSNAHLTIQLSNAQLTIWLIVAHLTIRLSNAPLTIWLRITNVTIFLIITNLTVLPIIPHLTLRPIITNLISICPLQISNFTPALPNKNYHTNQYNNPYRNSL